VKKQSPEKAVLKECLEYLQLRDIYAYRQNTGAAEYTDKTGKKRMVKYGKPGASDIVGVMPGGRFIAVECKAPTGRLSELQEEFLKDIERMGGLAVVAKSAEDIARAIKQDQACQKNERRS
jgi:hypothetical protein